MENQKFERGDIVRLKSGSPKMTVSGYDPEDGTDVTCTWFSDGELKEQSFHQDILRAYSPEDFSVFTSAPKNKYRY